jgi:hypothetical protein
LGAVLGGTASAERFLNELAKLAPTLSGESEVARRQALAKLLDEMGYLDLAASLANELCPIG